ncbi:MAG: hypothetical protein HKM02_09790 [Pseudomonadales bacterium]|nr:hypothetical protein [Pseudomonadales bacterium]
MRIQPRALALSISLALSACISQPPLIAPAEIDTALKSHDPQLDYSELAARLQHAHDLHGSRLKQAQTQLARLGSAIAHRMSHDLQGDLGHYTLSNGLIPLPILNAATLHALAIKKYDATQYAQTQQDLETLRGRTQARIDDLAQQRTNLDEEDRLGHYRLLTELIELSGDSRFERERSDLLANLEKQAQQAMQEGNFDQATALFNDLHSLQPDDAGIRISMYRARARNLEKTFWADISSNRVTDAFDLFMIAAHDKNFAALRPNLSKSGHDMIAFFVARGNAATQSGKLGDAYLSFHQERQMREMLEATPLHELPEEKSFIDKISEKLQAADHANTDGEALGLLLVMREFSSGNGASIKAQMHVLYEKIKQQAQHRISTVAFSSGQGDDNFGVAIAAQITESLFQTLPHDIRIVDNDQFHALLKSAGKQDDGQRPADYLIEGRLLEAHIDTTEEKGTKTMRVTTDTVTQTNPDYQTWLAMSSYERKKHPEPPATVDVDKQEEVTVNVNQVRKIGLMSASFRMVDAYSGRVVDTSTEVVKEDDADQGNEGVDIGKFRLPFKLPSLPSDTEIYDHLTRKLAQAIVHDLLDQLQDSDLRYAQAADHAASYGDPISASRYAAYAYVITHEKKKDSSSLANNLASYATEAASLTPLPPPAAVPIP